MEPNKVSVLQPEASDPLGIVRQAVAERAYRERNEAWDIGDTAWAVFDGDEHVANNPDNWHQALQLAQAHGIHLGISNPSFEYWYLLHYQDYHAQATRQQVMRLLKIHLAEYEKSSVLYQKELQSRTAEAIRRAQQVLHLAETNGLPRYDNPCTHVGKLVEIILSLERKIR